MPNAEPSRSAVVAGATGLIGRALVERLAQPDMPFGSVTALVRRKGAEFRAERVREIEVDYRHLADSAPHLAATDAFCCLGTTIKKAGSKAAFEEVDLTYVRTFARQARLAGARRFYLISAIGANPESMVFYSRIKGEAERAVSIEPFEGVCLIRPSLLLGERPNDSRPGEAFAIRVMGPLRNLFVGPLSPYRPMHGFEVADATASIAQAAPYGNRVYEPGELRAILKGGDARLYALEGKKR